MPTIEELKAKITALEEKLSHKPRRASVSKAEKARQKARHAQFKVDHWRRSRLHLSLNRYAR
jgi:hypothetical protein